MSTLPPIKESAHFHAHRAPDLSTKRTTSERGRSTAKRAGEQAMSDVAIAEPTRRQTARRNASAPSKVTGKLKQALDAMVWDGCTDNEAAVRTKMHVLSIRQALERPHVLAYYKAQREVLRTRELGPNIRRLVEIRDKADNMPAIQAIRMLEQMPDDAGQSGSRNQTPGMVIQIINNAPAETRVIDVKPESDIST